MSIISLRMDKNPQHSQLLRTLTFQARTLKLTAFESTAQIEPNSISQQHMKKFTYMIVQKQTVS